MQSYTPPVPAEATRCTGGSAHGAAAGPGHRQMISTQLLMLHDRAVRRPLGPWATELATELEQLARTPQRAHTFLSGVTSCANCAALIETHVGRPAAARAICSATLEWLAPVAGRGDPEGSALPLQSWVNIGRLHSLAGELETALAYYSAIPAYLRDEALRLGPVSIPAGHLDSDGEAGSRRCAQLQALYVIDSLKAMLRAGAHSAVLSFADGIAGLGWDDLVPFLWEGRILALNGLGEIDRALGMAAARLRMAASWERLVYQLRWAQLQTRFGAPDEAAPVRRELGAVAAALCASQRATLAALLFVREVADLLHEGGEVAQAYDTRVAALRAAQRMGDEVLEIELHQSLAATALDDGAGAHWRARLAALGARTAYARFRSGPPAPADLEAIDALSARLREQMRGQFDTGPSQTAEAWHPAVVAAGRAGREEVRPSGTASEGS